VDKSHITYTDRQGLAKPLLSERFHTALVQSGKITPEVSCTSISSPSWSSTATMVSASSSTLTPDASEGNATKLRKCAARRMLAKHTIVTDDQA